MEEVPSGSNLHGFLPLSRQNLHKQVIQVREEIYPTKPKDGYKTNPDYDNVL